MGNCCHDEQETWDKITQSKHRRTLKIVLAINLCMFFLEFAAGLYADSVSLLGDSLDMLGDAVVYGSSLAVVGLTLTKKVKVARLKAYTMLAFGLVISGRCLYQAYHLQSPQVSIMLLVGSMALFANLICLLYLRSSRSDDINMKSVYICSRNDVIANVAVLGSALVVGLTRSPWPDLVVGSCLAVLFCRSALGILAEARLAVD